MNYLILHLKILAQLKNVVLNFIAFCPKTGNLCEQLNKRQIYLLSKISLDMYLTKPELKVVDIIQFRRDRLYLTNNRSRNLVLVISGRV